VLVANLVPFVCLHSRRICLVKFDPIRKGVDNLSTPSYCKTEVSSVYGRAFVIFLSQLAASLDLLSSRRCSFLPEMPVLARSMHSQIFACEWIVSPCQNCQSDMVLNLFIQVFSCKGFGSSSGQTILSVLCDWLSLYADPPFLHRSGKCPSFYLQNLSPTCLRRCSFPAVCISVMFGGECLIYLHVFLLKQLS